MGLLQSKTALITGGSRGIGKSIVLKFASEGANVAFTYLSSEAQAEEVAAEGSKSGVKVKAYRSDASSYQDAEKLMTDVLADFGTLDILINNAGIAKDNLLMRMGEDQWDDVLRTNLKSIFNLTKQAIRPMMKNRSGSIINITSIVGLRGNAGQANYASSKAGIIGFTKSIAQELGSRNIRSNAISPGFIETEMTSHLTEDVKKTYMENIPMKRFGTGEEVAKVCVFLASDMGSYVSGQVISVCGGLYQ